MATLCEHKTPLLYQCSACIKCKCACHDHNIKISQSWTRFVGFCGQCAIKHDPKIALEKQEIRKRICDEIINQLRLEPFDINKALSDDYEILLRDGTLVLDIACVTEYGDRIVTSLLYESKSSKTPLRYRHRFNKFGQFHPEGTPSPMDLFVRRK